MHIWVLRAVPLGILALAAYGFWQGTPQDVVGAVRAGNVERLTAALERDPANVHTKVYAQAYESLKSRSDYVSRNGRDPWEGRYLIHDAVQVTFHAPPILDVLAAGGADLKVRLKGETLLHLAAAKGDIEVATWLLDHGADVHAVNDCTDGCAERGYTPLHSGLEFRDMEMTVLLLARGARLEATGADGRTAMHKAAIRGKLSGAFVLARHGADLARTDAAGKTPFDLSGVRLPGSEITDAELAKLKQWFAPGGPFATVSGIARKSGTPMREDDAREVFAKLDTTPR
ncbi:MAG: ankyrin repeat domain-containing protein [Pseudomonadota bacterium]